MFDQLQSEPPEQASGKTLQYLVVAAALAGAVVFAAVSGYMIGDMRDRIGKLEARATAAEQTSLQLRKELANRVGDTRAEMRSETDALAHRLVSTRKALENRAAAIKQQQEETAARLSEEQQRAVAAVSGEVSGVKSDVGSVRTDVATTRSELEATKVRLDRAIGDLGVQSGLIARTRDELEYLKHRGDRSYYEFTLTKSKRNTPVGGVVSLRLKKADAKRGTYTLDILADDRLIEKKNKSVSEPVQFYSGKDRELFEIVVFRVEKNQVTGYLSTPKGASTTADAVPRN